MAFDTLVNVRTLLDVNAWEAQAERTFNLYLKLAECVLRRSIHDSLPAD